MSRIKFRGAFIWSLYPALNSSPRRCNFSWVSATKEAATTTYYKMIAQLHLLSTDGVELVMRNVFSTLLDKMMEDTPASNFILSLPFSSFVLLEFFRSRMEGDCREQELLLVRPEVSAINRMLGIAVNWSDKPDNSDASEVSHEISVPTYLEDLSKDHDQEEINEEAAEDVNQTLTENDNPVVFQPQSASSLLVKNETLESFYEIQIELNETEAVETEVVESVETTTEPPAITTAIMFFASSANSDNIARSQNLNQDNLTTEMTTMSDGEENWSMEVNSNRPQESDPCNSSISDTTDQSFNLTPDSQHPILHTEEVEEEDIHAELNASKAPTPGKEFPGADSAWDLPEPQLMDTLNTTSAFYVADSIITEEQELVEVESNPVLKVVFVNNKNVSTMIRDVVIKKRSRKRKRGQY